MTTEPECTCPHIKLNGRRTEQRNLNPDCPVKAHRDKWDEAAQKLGFHR